MSMSWPGNVRELSNFVERQYILSESDILTSIHDTTNNKKNDTYQDIQNSISSAAAEDPDSLNMDKVVSSIEAALIKTSLKKSSNTKEAAKLLGISQPTFSRKYNKYKDMHLI